MTQIDVALQRIEDKLDTLKDDLHAVALATAGQQILQASLQTRVETAERDLRELKTAHDKALGMLKVLTVPGILSSLIAAYNIFSKV